MSQLADVIPHPSAPAVTRRCILNLNRGPCMRAWVHEDRAPGAALVYWVVVENIFVSGSQTVQGPISGQHAAIAIARASIG